MTSDDGELVERPRPDPTSASGVPRSVRRALWERDQGRCMECGNDNQDEIHPHHIVFRSQGGGQELDNLVIVCFKCHSLIHDRKLFVTIIDGVPYFGGPMSQRARARSLR